MPPAAASDSVTAAPKGESTAEAVQEEGSQESSPEVERRIDAIHSKTLDRSSRLQTSRPLGSMKSNSTSSLNNLSQIL